MRIEIFVRIGSLDVNHLDFLETRQRLFEQIIKSEDNSVQIEPQLAIMESFTAREVSTRKELDALIDVVWKAQYNPYDPAFSAFFPIFGPTVTDREAAIQESKDRLWQSHQSDPSSHWIYVRDPITGAVVGGTQWLIYETNPYVNGAPKMEASWWPEGSEGRTFCTELLRQCYAPRHQWMNRPHLGTSGL